MSKGRMYGDVVMVILYPNFTTYKLYGAYYDFAMILDGQIPSS